MECQCPFSDCDNSRFCISSPFWFHSPTWPHGSRVALRHVEITVAKSNYINWPVRRPSFHQLKAHLSSPKHNPVSSSCQNLTASLEATRCAIIPPLHYATYLSVHCTHQAALHNPNVSAEAKEHSRRVVEEIQGPGTVHDDLTTEPSSRRDDSGKDENRILGGYKATLKSPFLFSKHVQYEALIHLSPLCYRSQRRR